MKFTNDIIFISIIAYLEMKVFVMSSSRLFSDKKTFIRELTRRRHTISDSVPYQVRLTHSSLVVMNEKLVEFIKCGFVLQNNQIRPVMGSEKDKVQ